jgi:hypothetical protein
MKYIIIGLFMLFVCVSVFTIDTTLNHMSTHLSRAADELVEIRKDLDRLSAPVPDRVEICDGEECRFHYGILMAHTPTSVTLCDVDRINCHTLKGELVSTQLAGD